MPESLRFPKGQKFNQ
jgi:hypothetical protein